MDEKIMRQIAEIETLERIPERQFKYGTPEYRKARLRILAADNKIFEIKNAIAREFGARQGWRLSSKEFGPKVLARGGTFAREYETLRSDYLDHPFYYRKDRKAIALAVHLYASTSIDEKLVSWARDEGLSVWFPTDFPSWHFHGTTRLVVYVGQMGVYDLYNRGVYSFR